MLQNELEHLNQVKQGYEAWRWLCEDNKIFVQSLAKQYMRADNALNDSIEAGNIGILQAAIKYDVTRGYKFCAYAFPFVRREIERAVADKLSKDDNAFIECGIVLTEREAQILSAYFHSEPSMEELQKQLDITPERLNHIMNKVLLKLDINK